MGKKQKRTSGRSSLTSFSRISHSTSTGVSGLIAMPACMPSSWMYRISALGDVGVVVVLSSGFVAATDDTAAS
jgi:hypothetical protein